MGDSRRFHEFGKLILSHLPSKNVKVADVAGGKGYLQLWLREQGLGHVTTFDKRHSYITTKKIRVLNYVHQYFHFKTPLKFDFVCGMHCDEGTDHIIQYAVDHGIPFLVCPCCVKPDATQMAVNRNWTNWLKHLTAICAKTHKIWYERLKIDGKNLCLYGEPK